MDPKLFEKLYESITQMNELVEGERTPSRKFIVGSVQVKEIRKKQGKPKKSFAI